MKEIISFLLQDWKIIAGIFGIGTLLSGMIIRHGTGQKNIQKPRGNKYTSPLKIYPPETQYLSMLSIHGSLIHAVLLKVENISGDPIFNVFGKITSINLVSPMLNKSHIPIVPIESLLTWQGEQAPRVIPIGSYCYLKIAETVFPPSKAPNPQNICIQTIDGKRYQVSMVPGFIFNIEIGIEKQKFLPQSVRVKVFWGESGELRGQLL